MSKITDVLKTLKDIKEIKQIADLLIEEVHPYIERTANGIADLKMKSIKKYMDNGFTKQESILLTIDSSKALSSALDRYNVGNNND